jgi:hypothetical protein
MSTATQPQQYMRLQDRASVPMGPVQLNVAQLTRIWRHTDPQPHDLREVHIVETAGALSIQCYGNGKNVPLSSQSVQASMIFAANPLSRDGMSFFAEFDFGHMISQYQGNVNLGLMVLAVFHNFRNDKASSNYFSREFFYSVDDLLPQPSSPATFAQTVGSKHLDCSSLLGFWRNTNQASLGIASIKISPRGGDLAIHAYGVGESGSNVDWGETTASVYAKDSASADAMAFSTVFNQGDIHCHLQANVKQGVLVVAYFTEFRDGSGRSNYFSREFYYKETL